MNIKDPRFSFLQSITNANEQHISELLGMTTIRITITPAAIVTFAGQVLVYQLTTLLARLFDRIELFGEEDIPTDPRMVLLSGTFLSELRKLLPTIRSANPLPKLSEVNVLVGAGADLDKIGTNLICLGATGWGARFSKLAAQPVVDTSNPLGSLAAGALGAAEIFKAVFSTRIEGAVLAPEYSLSLLNYDSINDAEPEPELPSQVDIDAVLFGCGSIGCGLVMGLLLTPQLHGSVVAVDKEHFDEQNLYKYSLLSKADIVKPAFKAVWVQKLLHKLAGGRINAQAFVGTAEGYVNSLPYNYAIPLAISAVDSLKSRWEIQDTLPYRIINAGIAATTAEVSVHGFGDGPCLACLVLAERNHSWDPKPLAERLGLTPERILQLSQNSAVLTAADVENIKQHGKLSGVNLSIVESFIGMPLMVFWARAGYSEATVQVDGGGPAHVTTAFVSAFAGTLLLTELIKQSVPEFEPFIVGNSYRHEVVGVPGYGVFKEQRDFTGNCLCHSGFRLMLYGEKYLDSGQAAKRYAA